MVNEAAKARLLSEVAAAAGMAETAAKAAAAALARRNEVMVRAKAANASYQELQDAAGIARTGVYKALSSAVGGSLRQ